MFGGAKSTTPITTEIDSVQKGSVPEEPATELASLSEPAEVASFDSCTATPPAEAPVEAELEAPTPQADLPVSQVSLPAASDDVSTTSETSETSESSEMPLHVAASRGQADAIANLLAQGANVSVTDHLGRTPLHHAVLHRSNEVAELLLAHGANVNARNTYGLTPLHTTARFGMKDLAALLVVRGADVNAADNFGETPLQCAIERSQHEVAELLRQSGAEDHAVIEQAPPGSLIQFEVAQAQCESETCTESRADGELPHGSGDLSREEIYNRRLARKKAAREAKRIRALERHALTAIAA